MRAPRHDKEHMGKSVIFWSARVRNGNTCVCVGVGACACSIPSVLFSSILQSSSRDDGAIMFVLVLVSSLP